MATKSTNSTIITLAAVAIGGYAAYKYFNRRTTQARTGGESVGDGYEEDQPYDPTQSNQGSLLSQLAQLLGGNRSGGGSTGSGAGGLGGGSGLGSSSSDPLGSFINDFTFLGADAAEASNPAFGGDSLDSYQPDNSGGQLDNYQFQLDNSTPELLDVPGQDIPSEAPLTYQSETLNDTIPDDTGISMDDGGDAG